MNLRSFAAFLLCFSSSILLAEERPNILWLSCEDISPHLGCYGDPHAITPHLDTLAKEGTRYTHAFTAAGCVCPLPIDDHYGNVPKFDWYSSHAVQCYASGLADPISGVVA